MLAVVMTLWSGLRVMWWEPLPVAAAGGPGEGQVAQGAGAGGPPMMPVAMLVPPFRPLEMLAVGSAVLTGRLAPALGRHAPGAAGGPRGVPDLLSGRPAAGREPPAPAPAPAAAAPLAVPSPPPFLAAPAPAEPGAAAGRGAGGGRWSLDAWAFWREGSAAAPVSQGRVPVYGASQAGAVLQYRLAPGSRHDPRLYARAYRALVPRGESEAALGASLRPLERVPLRLAGEVRYTDAAFFDDVRPAAYAVTELPPLALPLGTALEVYGQAGWVGGAGATPFADAQASLTRALPLVDRLTGDRMRLSMGAGAWGGAQDDAQRVDIGPTLRLDTRIGQVPARVSVDWRMRVAGHAAPGSGVAATVSTGF